VIEALLTKHLQLAVLNVTALFTQHCENAGLRVVKKNF